MGEHAEGCPQVGAMDHRVEDRRRVPGSVLRYKEEGNHKDGGGGKREVARTHRREGKGVNAYAELLAELTRARMGEGKVVRGLFPAWPLKGPSRLQGVKPMSQKEKVPSS